ncbi:MAG: hypothetical protein ACR2LL_13485 [Nitrosopumilus sp.]
MICASCKEDLVLLDKQLNVNSERIKKLEEHKKSIEPQLKNLQSETNHEMLLETKKRLVRNLQIEYDLRDGILEAINSKDKF